MSAGDSLSPEVRRAAIDMWMCGSSDSTQMLMAVEAALRKHESAALGLSAQGKGSHAAAALRWAAERLSTVDALPTQTVADAGDLRRWADEAES